MKQIFAHSTFYLLSSVISGLGISSYGIIIRHEFVYIFILQLKSLLVYNGYCMSNKVGLPQAQQCMLYFHP